MLEGLLIGLGAAFSFQNIIMVVLGCLTGTFIGMLPGLGPMSIIAIMIPIAITIGDPSAALILLAGVYYGAIFGGSTSSILLNAPGVAGTVATSFDGYPMARRGQAGKALTVAAIASFAGGTIGAVLLMIFAPALSTVALLFHSAEYFALMVVGLSAIAAFAGSGNVAKLRGLNQGILGEGRPADIIFMDRPSGSEGNDFSDAMSMGNIPGIAAVMIDGKMRVGRSRSTPPSARVPIL